MEVLDEVGVGICGGIFRELACLPGRGPGICRYSNGRKTADENEEGLFSGEPSRGRLPFASSVRPSRKLESVGGEDGDMLIMVGVEQVELTQLRVTQEMAENRRQQFEQLFAQYRKMREEIDANPEIREKPRWFEKISGVYWRMDRAHRVVRMFQRQQAGAPLPVTLYAVRIGDMVIATHPVALYLDFGMQIKARSKAVQTFTVQTADGHHRYLPTARSLAGSAYGAVPESITFGPQGGRELVEATLELIESLWEE